MRRSAMACTTATTFVKSSATPETKLSIALFVDGMCRSELDPGAMTEPLSPAAAQVCALIPWSPAGDAIVNLPNQPMPEL